MEDCSVSSFIGNLFQSNIVISSSIIVTICSITANTLASFGVWSLYRRPMGRTPKLLLSLFVTNCLTVFAVVSLCLYRFTEEFQQLFYYSIHISIIAFLTLWSSEMVFLVTLDRYLIIVRGRWYLLFKKSFPFLLFGCAFIISTFSAYMFYAMTYMGSTANIIHLLVYGGILAINLTLCLLFNVKMLIYVRRKLTLVGSIGVGLRNSVAKTVFSMTLSSTFCQTFQITVLEFFVTSILTKSNISNCGYMLGILFIYCVMTHAGITPLIYFLRNKRMACCVNITRSFVFDCKC